jgi:hypothetical protein
MWDMDLKDLSHVPNNKSNTPNLDVELPFQIATNNDELEKIIEGFDLSVYQGKLEQFYKCVGMVFNGNASGEIANIIERTIVY